LQALRAAGQQPGGMAPGGPGGAAPPQAPTGA
jgi:hypothetical protein